MDTVEDSQDSDLALATVTVQNRDFAFQNRLKTFSIVNHGHSNLDDFFADALDSFITKMNTIIDEQTIVVVAACFLGEFVKMSIGESSGAAQYEKQNVYTHTVGKIIDFETVLSDYFNESVVTTVKNRIEESELRGSGFTLSKIIELNIQVSSFEPLAGSSFIPLPQFLSAKKSVVNVRNYDDEMCFQYAVLSALFPPNTNPYRTTPYNRYIADKVLDFTGIDFPVKLRDISRFEKQNPDISIHVYMPNETKKTVHPVRLAKEIKRKHLHLLMLTEVSKESDGDGNFATKSHYCWIKNLSGVIGKQAATNCRKKFFCDRCLNHFYSQSRLDVHLFDCLTKNECTITMPTADNNKIRFEKIQNQLMVPFVIYADIESLLKQPSEPFCKSEKTTAYQQHEAYSIGYYFKHFYDDSQSYYRSYRNEDCIDWFVKELENLAYRIGSMMNEARSMRKTYQNEKRFREAKQCHICGGKYKRGDSIVRDHSHFTGEYRGSAHNKCNLQFKESRYVPVIFHNLSHYDSHFIIKKLALNIEGSISAIPINDELYISFTKAIPNNSKKFENFVKLRFIDSFRFMPSSLDYLASLLPSDKKKISHHQLKERKMTDTQIKLLERKGVFCYDYVDSWSKLDENHLPTQDTFFSKLTESNISDEQYEHAQLVWNEFGVKTLGEYSDLYMQTDILLLADVFENFRETCHTIYGLDPAHYFTAPGLSFDAMLKYTKIEIELLTDVDMLLFIEKGIRGGTSQCSKRYAKANNKHMTSDTNANKYDPSKESNYLIYLDANNLYGHSMCQYLPWKDFVWSTHRFTVHTIMQIHSQSCDGYIFEVDLEYPKNLHDLHSDYPMCPEKKIVSGGSSKQTKLLLTLDDKEHYVIHYKMLQLALQQGLKLKKIHRVLKFEQRAWLKPYIDMNTEMRMRATNEFDKNFFKLMINTIFGKTMENMRGRVDIKIRTKWEGRYGIRKLIAKPNFKRWTAFDSDLVAVHMKQVEIQMNKPISIGMAVLDLSKILMYDFYYNFMKPRYGANVEMMYTDTDSLILDIKTDCFYTDMIESIDEWYDTSDFAENNPYKIPRKNKKKPGYFKDELNGKIMTEFAGLRSKMYAFKFDDMQVKKAKGVKQYVLKKSIQFADYYDCVKNRNLVVRAQNSFRTKKHCVFSVRQEKIALSPFDDKRYILQDNVNTLPWGHYRISEEEKEIEQE